MPVESILAACAVVAMFSAFAGAVAWANRQSTLARAPKAVPVMQPAE